MVRFLAIVALTLIATSASAESPTWPQVQAACGGEYRAAKGQADRPAWSEFLNTCKVRKGFVPKRGTKAIVTLPDVN